MKLSYPLQHTVNFSVLQVVFLLSRCAVALLTSFVIIVSCATTSDAAVVISQVSSTTELAYTNSVSNSDLLHGLTPTTTGWNSATGASKLNDGVHGDTHATDGTTSIAWTTVGATATYNLGTGDGSGWDITAIQSIAAWRSASFGNQACDVSVRYMCLDSFTPLPTLTVDYQPLGGVGVTRVAISNDTEILTNGIEEMRFTARNVNGRDNRGGFSLREIDVQGYVFVFIDSDSDGMPDNFELAHTDPLGWYKMWGRG